MHISELPLSYVLNPSERLFWLYLLSAAVFAYVLTAWQGRKMPHISIDSSYWLHPSAIVDYKYFFVIWFFKMYLVAPLVFSAREVALWTHTIARDYLEPMFDVSYTTVAWAYTIALFVSSDFTRYLLHRALHSSDFLWEFHKVHHSAEVLNPVTFYRIHPFESFLFGVRYSLTAGVVTGIFMTLFGAKLTVVQIVSVNIFLFVFSIIGSNLRHSHIYLRFPAWLERLIVSPVQHQIHHQYRTSRTNYGGSLAIWDWFFGSLKSSANTERPLKFGIAQSEMQDYDTVTKLLIMPFKKLLRKD